MVINFWVANLTCAFLEFSIEILADIKLNGVVSSSKSLDIVLNKVINLNTSDVIDVHNHEERKEDTNTSLVKTKNLSLSEFIISVGTSNLKEEHGGGFEAIIRGRVIIAGNLVLAQIGNGAILLTLAVSSHVCLEIVVVEVRFHAVRVIFWKTSSCAVVRLSVISSDDTIVKDGFIVLLG